MYCTYILVLLVVVVKTGGHTERQKCWFTRIRYCTCTWTTDVSSVRYNQSVKAGFRNWFSDPGNFLQKSHIRLAIKLK
ncbi:hypothetical protein B0I72DRAFT_134266 [Yarrowia lipolytica]|uniref:Secreted protein n=1 Tax=Yarrowia lipolytica TaxID=4952 RepID=A0A371CF66_YARLL|nr:hypothetical protein BKA91DRAFT_139757 [Yarrowia lipolytica]KAE8171926.1 hypothetical protein BKA90DRAFT_138224 [Yarrowia lipolytica]RDW28909.1 hypothetical protein B0I71DRAFT_126530 [Yarrowia lipolytica]RDW34639.1 hypothetical protein B0I72DRAFT_134266 [Yarrowia lipolytica]RDW37909.1 hypothetical protein B0I73DRAFT_134746 [Yarrowia lipolytica]